MNPLLVHKYTSAFMFVLIGYFIISFFLSTRNPGYYNCKIWFNFLQVRDTKFLSHSHKGKIECLTNKHAKLKVYALSPKEIILNLVFIHLLIYTYTI